MKKLLNFVKILLSIFLFISIVLLFLGFYYLYQKIDKISDSDTASEGKIEQTVVDQVSKDREQTVLQCSEVCVSEISSLISEAIATLSGAPVTVVQAPTQSTPKIDYISMGTSATTTSTSWVDVDDSEVYIDIENDYGKNAKVSWEASLKVAHGNGQAFARLWDDTNKIAVDFSEISTKDNVDFEQKSSAHLPFWRGRNIYKVQIKSLNSFEITYSGGRIKVSY